MRAVRINTVMCALTLTAPSPFPLDPPAGVDEPAVPAAAPADAPVVGAITTSLLGITGLHGHISRTTQMNSGTGQTSAEDPGAVTLAYEVSSARAANPDTSFVSAGNSVGRLAYVPSILQDRSTIEALNAMSLGVSALGNHELDQSLINLKVCILPVSNFPILAANVPGSTSLSAGGDGKEVFIKKVGGVRVGFIGVVTDELPTLMSLSVLSTLTLNPAVAAANARIAELKDGGPADDEADIVVVLSHEDAAFTATSFSKNVNAVFSGYTHVLSARTIAGAEGNQIVVVQADHYGQALGHVRLGHDPASRKASVVSTDSKDLRSLNCTIGAHGVAEIVSQTEKDSAAKDGRPLAKIDSDFLRGSDGSGPSANCGTESTVSNLTAEPFRSWPATDIQPAGSTCYVGIMSPGGVRVSLLYAASGSEGNGALISGETYTIQPFGNEMTYTALANAELKTLLSQQQQPGSSCPVLTLGLSRNVDVLIKATADPGYGSEVGVVPAIREILVDGRSLADGDGVAVAFNSSLLTGGDGYTVPKDKPVTNTSVLDRDVTSAYLASFGGKPVTADYSRRQTATTVGPVYTSSGGVRSTDAVSVTLGSLAYTNPTEQAASTRRVRVSAGDKEILIKDLDLIVNPTGLTAGRIDFSFTFPADIPTCACRTAQAATCRWALVRTLDAVGTVLNRFSAEIEDEDTADPGADSGGGAVAGADVTTDGADGKATSAPQSDPGAGETSVGSSTEPPAGSGTQPAATVAPAVSGAPVQATGPERPNQAVNDSPLTLVGASLSVGALVLTPLIVGGYLILHRRQQVA